VDGLHAVPRETRTHVKIEPGTQTGEEGMLFATEGLLFSDRMRALPGDASADQRARAAFDHAGRETALLAHVYAEATWDHGPTFVPLGGERRLAELTTADIWPGWDATRAAQLDAVVRAGNIRGLRLQLVTPALFGGGWRPGAGLPFAIDGLGVELALVAAAVGRRVPVSGWGLTRRSRGANSARTERGIRETRYAAPAGAVYFYELTKGAITAELFARLWLRPIADDRLHRRDGFGLVLPGIW